MPDGQIAGQVLINVGLAGVWTPENGQVVDVVEGAKTLPTGPIARPASSEVHRVPYIHRALQAWWPH